MVLRHKLTPESFLEMPLRSAAVPSPSGRVAFFTVSTHRFVDDGNAPGTATKELFLLDLATGEAWPFAVRGGHEGGATNDVAQGGDLAWVPRDDATETRGGDVDELLWLRPAAESAATAPEPAGSTTLVVAAATHAPGGQPAWPPYVAGVVPAPISALRLKALPDGTVALAVAGLVGPGGALFNEKAQPPSGSSARIYDTWQVRAWDQYLKPQPYAIWYSLLARTSAEAPHQPYLRWQLASELHNALQHAPPRFEAPLGIYEPGDATAAYDIGAQGIVFSVRDPSPANPHHTSCSEVYYVPLDSFAAPTAYKPARIAVIPANPAAVASVSGPPGEAARHPPGVSFNPRFSPDGTMLAFLWGPLACPADLRLFMGHIVSGAVHDVVATVVQPQDLTGGESTQDDRPVPYAFEFAPTGRSVFLQAHSCGRRSLFVMDLRAGARPRLVSGKRGSVASFHAVRRRSDGENQGRGSDRLSAYAVLLSGSSFVESSFYQMADLTDGGGYGRDESDDDAAFEPRVVSTASNDGSRFGLSYDLQVSEMYFEGGGEGGHGGAADSYCVQAWVVRPPPSYDDDNGNGNGGGGGSRPDAHEKKRPLALLVHGGPEGAFDDEWHLRWNAAVWAAQGYAVVLPNITGSLGFGLAHTTRIYDNWGGSPYDDLAQCMAALRRMPDIDCSRAIVAGASYGGYMVAWLHGSPLGRAFTAAVCHDPVFSTEFMGLTSDYSDGIATFSGPGFSWENEQRLARWNPTRPDRLAVWATNAAPTLVVHSDRDFRCVVTEGQGVFRVLKFQGVPTRYLNFPDESHFVTRPDNALVWHRVVFAWLRQWRDVQRRL
ncbi:hypothetical protein SCUCBS95973_001304 [Sporothrix curviconia]|uniref:Dipeptidyl-peptidase V n=1 Tax=Sporothrix curviconia TaxID=1260050 RepID=A0ABP0AY13_9PEZI